MSIGRATPRPWIKTRAENTGWTIEHPTERYCDPVAAVYGPGRRYDDNPEWEAPCAESKANAAMIVHAANNHEPLVAALSDLLDHPIFDGAPDDDETLNKARGALAAAVAGASDDA